MALYNTQPKEVWREDNTLKNNIQLGGLVERIIPCHALFDRCNREKDSTEIWTNIEKRFQTKGAK